MAKEDSNTTTYLLRSIPNELYAEARKLAKARGLTFRVQVLLLLEDFVNAGTKDKKKEA